MRLLTIFILMMTCLTAIAQTSPTGVWVDSEVKYTDSVGKVIVIHNSLPKGGGSYIDLAGEKYSYVIFWTRVVNESATPLELVIKFPADSLAIFHSPDSYIRIFLPPDTMTLGKIPLGDYGLNNLQSSASAGFDKPSMLQKTLKYKEEYIFYIPVLIHQARGTARAALVLQGQDLFYRISIDPQAALIPCGRIVFKN